MNELEKYLDLSSKTPGWRRPEDAQHLIHIAFHLPPDATVVEIGVFLGRTSVLLAGARKVRGSGRVYCIDPFDCSGDPFSVPHYQEVLASVGGGSLEHHFIENLRSAQLTDWIEILRGDAVSIARNWTKPVDLLVLDGDQSRRGARLAYDAWVPFLKVGGFIALANSRPGLYGADHDGHYRVASEELKDPEYDCVQQSVRMTFARNARAKTNSSPTGTGST